MRIRKRGAQIMALLAVAAAAALGAGCSRPGTGGSAGGDAAASDVPAASVSYADIAGIRAAVERHRGRPLLLNFWATWCVPCLEELPDFARLARAPEGDGWPAFLGVSLDAWVSGEGAETEAMVKRSLASAGVTYDNLIYDGEQDPLVEAFGISGAIPYSILYDGAGRKITAWEGTVDLDELRQAVTPGR